VLVDLILPAVFEEMFATGVSQVRVIQGAEKFPPELRPHFLADLPCRPSFRASFWMADHTP